jgi:uncharacterized protein YjhX (UPF0386 family)
MVIDARRRADRKRSRHLHVFLNGHRLEHCFKADTRIGKAHVYWKEYYTHPDDPSTRYFRRHVRVVRGHVELRQQEAA